MKGYIISLSFGNYLKADGGVDKAINDYQKIFNNNGIDYLHISPVVPKAIVREIFLNKKIYTIVFNGIYKGFYDGNDVCNYINELKVLNMNCVGIHIHHTMKFDVLFVQNLIKMMNVPVYFFLHDYYSICENPNLLFNDEKFCGSAKKKKGTCEKCKYGINKEKHILRTISILKMCKELYIVSPSELTLNIWKETYSEIFYNVKYLDVPHQQAIGKFDIFPQVNKKIRIGFIGRYGDNKGKKQWEELVKVIEEQKLPYELFYLGGSIIPNNTVKKIEVRVDSQNPDKMLQEMRKSGINCAFLWSICPETYSYAYFEAWASNLFVITNKDSGNIAHMVDKNKNGIVYDDFNAFIQEIIDVKKIRESLEEFTTDKDRRGPYSYIVNPDITDLYGKKEYDNVLKNTGDKVNNFLKKIMEFFYLKKNR